MSDERIAEYLRSRAREEPPPDLVSSVMVAVDRTPRRGGWLPTVVPALAGTAAIAAAAIVLAVLIAQGGGFSGAPSSPAADRSPEPTATPGATPEPTATPGATPEPPFGASVFEDPDDCEDDSVGYRVAFPDAWWWNEPYESAIGPHASCRFFAPAEFDAMSVIRERPIPEGVAIHVSVIGPDGSLGQLGEVVSSEELTVAAHPAVREEQASTPGGFLEPGERVYRYVIELPEERLLVFTAGNLAGDYAENRAVLDAMMETLELFEPDEIRCGPPGDVFICGQILVTLSDDAVEPIETVVERNGGDPATDIINRVPERGMYAIAVAHGTEGDVIARYRTDEAVASAELNGG